MATDKNTVHGSLGIGTYSTDALCIRCHQPICFEFGQWKHVYHDAVTALCWVGSAYCITQPTAVELEQGYSLEPIESKQTVTFMPSNDYGIREGYYTGYGIVRLLREHKGNPDAVQFIADMLE